MDLDEVVYQIACGLDVHFTFVTACLVTTGPKGKPKVEERRFPTNQKGLSSLREWLVKASCEAVGMEATGVYWMPVYAALEGACTLVVGNPQHMKNARGHKTDRLDARWIAGQVRHGRIRSSFVPPPEFREARRLARCRRQLVEARTSIRNEIQRLLAEVGITLAGVVSDVFGTSGTSILNALAEGRCVRDELSIHLYSSLRKKDKMASIAAALEAPLPEVSRQLLAIHLRRIEALEGNIGEVETLLFRQLAPHAAKLDLLQKIPGISKLSAHIILAEIGVDMDVWPTDKKFSAWAGVAPGCNQTGGRSKRAAVRKGNPYLCTILMECAGGAVKKQDSHLRIKHRKLCAQLGSKKKARMAIAHKLALIIYKVLGENVEYVDPKPEQPSEKTKRRMVHTRIKDLERLGYRVVLEPLEDVP